jgi:hypothetical protein
MESARLLSARLNEALFRRAGSDQHIEIAGYLREAEKTVLDPTAADAVRKLRDEATWTVESNLDLVKWPGGPVWYEMPGYIMNLQEGEDPRMGFLVLPHPQGGGIYMVVTAFSTASIEPRHCFAMSLIDAGALAENAYFARRYYSHAQDESLERLMGHIGVSISDDFRDELMITEDGREEVIEAVMRDATADIPLLLALMVAEASENGFVLDMSEEGNTLVGAPLPGRTRLGEFADRFARRMSSGIVRFPRGRKAPRLAWFA